MDFIIYLFFFFWQGKFSLKYNIGEKNKNYKFFFTAIVKDWNELPRKVAKEGKKE